MALQRTLSESVGTRADSFATTGSLEEASHYFRDSEMEDAPAHRRRTSDPFLASAFRQSMRTSRSSSFTGRDEAARALPPLAVTIITNMKDNRTLSGIGDSLYDENDPNRLDETIIAKQELSESRSSTCTTHSQSTTSSVERYFFREEEQESSNRSVCESLGYSVDSQERVGLDWPHGAGTEPGNPGDAYHCADLDDYRNSIYRDGATPSGDGGNPCFRLPFARLFAGLFRDRRNFLDNQASRPQSFQRPMEL